MTSSGFYHPVTVGNLTIDGNLFLAPVAGYSDCAFRSICRDCGADFAYTEMVSAEALSRGSDKTASLIHRAHNENKFAVQLFGGVPESMEAAVQKVLSDAGPELLDINAGCPVPKIVKSGAGSALTKEPAKLAAVVGAAVKAAETFAARNGTAVVPVTVKIRSGWDSNTITYREAAQAAVGAGAKAVTMHARTKAQGYEGKADWALLADLKSRLSGIVPVFGSGDVFSPEDALRMFEETGVDGVMFARGAMGNPFIFTRTKALLTTGSYEETASNVRFATGMHELDLLIEEKGEEVACREMRKRFCCYTKGSNGGAELRRKIVAACTLEDYRQIFDGLY